MLTAIAREKVIREWNRVKKAALFRKKNPERVFLNEQVCGTWLPQILVKQF